MNRIFDALQEGKFMAVMELYERGLLPKLPNSTDEQSIRYYVRKVFNEDDTNYWMDWFFKPLGPSNQQ